VPLILLFLSIIVDFVVSGGAYRDNPIIHLIGAALVFCWALSPIPILIGLITIIIERAARRRENATAKNEPSEHHLSS
jgi:hypothetical protein